MTDIEYARQRSAQTWHTPKNKKKIMDTELCEAFAEILCDEILMGKASLEMDLYEIRELSKELVNAIEELQTWQNGAPLATYEEGWNKAMDMANGVVKKAEKLLKKDGGGE